MTKALKNILLISVVGAFAMGCGSISNHSNESLIDTKKESRNEAKTQTPVLDYLNNNRIDRW